MESQSEYSKDYEEDFEESKISGVKSSEKGDVKEKGEFRDSEYRPNDIFKQDILAQKKSSQALEKENYRLRCDLKALSDEINELLLVKKSSKLLSTDKKSTKSVSDVSRSNFAFKKMMAYEQEYKMFKEIYAKFKFASKKTKNQQCNL